MSDKPERRMRAYYYGFSPTGVDAIDKILSAVACAGKSFHHTEDWHDECPPSWDHSGNTPEEWIQRAADEAAAAWAKNAGLFVHVTPKPDACEHDFQGWREFSDGNGGEQVCTKCGMGAMAYTLRTGP